MKSFHDYLKENTKQWRLVRFWRWYDRLPEPQRFLIFLMFMCPFLVGTSLTRESPGIAASLIGLTGLICLSKGVCEIS